MISVLITLTFAFMISFVCFAIQALLQERELQKLKKEADELYDRLGFNEQL